MVSSRNPAFSRILSNMYRYDFVENDFADSKLAMPTTKLPSVFQKAAGLAVPVDASALPSKRIWNVSEIDFFQSTGSFFN